MIPTLFPYGIGDITNKDRMSAVSLTESNNHLQKYAVFDEKQKKWIYPFAKHNRWCHYVQNICEHHRVNSNTSFYLHSNKEHSNLSEEELVKIFEDGGDELNQLMGKM